MQTQPSLSDSGRGALQIISGSDHLHRQETRRHRGAAGLLAPIVVLWLVSLVVGLGLVATEIARLAGLTDFRPPSWVSIAGLAMILLDYALLPPVERLLQERDQYRQGRRGEDAAVEALAQHLDHNWTVFRNVVLPAAKADIDAVLVGPSGVYMLEIKSYRGRFKNRGDEWWWRRYGPGWRRMDRSPSRQAKANAAGLGEYLREALGEKVWVEPRVVWVGPGKLYIEGRPGTYV